MFRGKGITTKWRTLTEGNDVRAGSCGASGKSGKRRGGGSSETENENRARGVEEV